MTNLTVTQRIAIDAWKKKFEITSLVKTFDNYSMETEQDLIKKEVCRRVAVLSMKIAEYAIDEKIAHAEIEELKNISDVIA